MKKEIAEKWVAALRSGKYKQTTGHLRDSKQDQDQDGFCCLGVLCDIVKDDVNGSWGREDERSKNLDEPGSYVFRIKEIDGSSFIDSSVNLLPGSVLLFAGLRDTDPTIKSIRCESLCDVSLTVLNDGSELSGIQPHSFEEIADIIEKEWESL